MSRLTSAIQLCALGLALPLTLTDPLAFLPGFRPGPAFGEQVREERFPIGVRLVTNLPATLDPKRPNRVIFYATPNGNTIEQTLGRGTAVRGRGLGSGVRSGEPTTHNSQLTTSEGDWHFDIQHIAAQTRALRAANKRENIILVCLEPDKLSWPAWRREHTDNAAQIREIVERTVAGLPGDRKRVTLTGHSGGGSFTFGYLNGHDAIPSNVDRIAFLDSNYAFSVDERHGAKLQKWLQGDPSRRLVVIAYDDRSITLDGKPVVGPTGGTYRATDRMVRAFGKNGRMGERASGGADEWKSGSPGPWDETLWSPLRSGSSTQNSKLRSHNSAGGRALFLVHGNPENKILHTALVGEMNGYLHAMTWDTPEETSWGKFGGPRAYTRWIEGGAASTFAPPAIPQPSASAPRLGGKAFMESIAALPEREREAAILKELGSGNIPDFLRKFRTVTLDGTDTRGQKHTVELSVMPDYLSVGIDTDFVRVPMTPQTAQRLADAFGCALPTRKIVDAIHRQADVKLEPRPMTRDREAVATFVEHNGLIEQERIRDGRPLGALISGIKKDVVVTPLLQARPGRVAIYGWHRLDGKPIQPLTTVHAQSYVDYSHGIRLVRQTVLVDGKPSTLADLLKDPVLHLLLSDEGALERPAY